VQALDAHQRPQGGLAHGRVGAEGDDRSDRGCPASDGVRDRAEELGQGAPAGGIRDHQADTSTVQLDVVELRSDERGDHVGVEHSARSTERHRPHVSASPLDGGA
jgi:hypothetical protein